MNKQVDPFTDGANEPTIDQISLDGEVSVNNRLGMSNVRQALSRWWIMLIFGTVGYLGALYYMSIQPQTNEAVAVLELDLKQRNLIGEELESRRISSDVLMATLINKMTSKGVLTEVAESPEVQALQSAVIPEFSFIPRYWRTEKELTYKPASSVESHQIVGMIAGGLSLNPRRDTALLDVTMNHPDPDTACVIVDTLLKIYLDKVESQLAGGSLDAYQILKSESEGADEEVKAAEKSLQVYVSALALNELVQEKRAQIIILRQRYKSMHPTRVQEEAIYADLLKRFKREIRRASENVVEKSYWLDHKDEMEALQSKVEAGGDDALEADDEWLALTQNALSSRANLLNATIERERNQYNTLRKRMTEIDVGDEDTMNNLVVIEPAFIGTSKDSLRLVYLAVGSFLGVFVGFAVAYMLSVIDYKIYDVRSAEEATGLTCMAAIPESSKFQQSGDWETILTRDATSANSESIRNLRASIVLLGKQKRNKLILVTSSIPGEGKTTVSSEIAGAFAMNKEKTLLIDLDLRRPKLTDNFPEAKNQLGISEVLAGLAEIETVSFPTNIPQLTFIGCGGKCPNPSELLNEEELVELLDKLIPQYDRIIIDSAPVLPVSDSRLLAKHTHKVLLVVRSRKTPIGAIIRSKELLEKSGATIAGVVVNGMKRSSGGSYFNGYKGYGEYGGDDYGYYGDSK